MFNQLMTVSQALTVTPADVNGDGAVDLVVPIYGGAGVVWLQSDGGAVPSFTARNVVADGSGLPGALQAAVTDFGTEWAAT